ncbi:type II toxin-antitoxin system HicB family antitoxin [Lactobacillus sp. HT06-2]|uniref:type II toxin-antitoxin system HicB family antitoxin n=1 Tax=Lactobacillus sp. HT06-2 TaxID=2080222 RepID=UPI000CD97E89|nr:type II toxin-antitoxin system HicB family antitoxin [Lactobacillus sp. HT06-2]
MVSYFAIFLKNEKGQYEVTFPDLVPYAATFGDTLKEAIQSAHESLAGYLLTKEDFNEKVPTPSSGPMKFKVKKPDFIAPVEVNLDLERKKNSIGEFFQS